ncbi:MAG: hypothetical protein WD558_07830 [Pseudomonadales bacterium]
MADYLFWFLIALYALVAVKVDQWFTISRLGFKTETPILFLTNPKAYHWTRMLLFGAAIAALLFASNLALYSGAVALVAVWLGAFWIGRKMAFSAYRRIHREMIADEEDMKVLDPEEYERMFAGEDPVVHRAYLEKGARMTDRELIERIERVMKWGM